MSRSPDSDDYDLIQVDDATSSTAGSPPPTPPSPPARVLFGVDDASVPVSDSDGSRVDACGALDDMTRAGAMDPVECAMGMNTKNGDRAVQEGDGGADAGPDATPSLDSTHRDLTGATVGETITMASGATIIADPSDPEPSGHGDDLAAPALGRDGDALPANPASPSDSAIISASAEQITPAPITADICDEIVDRDALLLVGDTNHIHHDALPANGTDHIPQHASAPLDADAVPVAHHQIPPPPPTRVTSHISDSAAHTKSTLVRMAVPIPASSAEASFSPVPPPSRLVLIAVTPQMISIDKVVAAAAAANAHGVVEHEEKELVATDRENKADGADEIKLTVAGQHDAPMEVNDAPVAEIHASLATSASDSFLAPAASTHHDNGDDEPHAHHDRHPTERAVPLRILLGLSDDDSSLDDELHSHSDLEYLMAHSWIRSYRHPDTGPINAPAVAMGVPGVSTDLGRATDDHFARLLGLMPSDEPTPMVAPPSSSTSAHPPTGSGSIRDRRRAPSVARHTRRQAALSPYAATRPMPVTVKRAYRDYPPHRHHPHVTSSLSIPTALFAGLLTLLAVTFIMFLAVVAPTLRRGMDVTTTATAAAQVRTVAAPPVTLTHTVSIAAPTVTVTSIILDATTATQTEVVVRTATVTATATVELHADSDDTHSAPEPMVESAVPDDDDGVATTQEPTPLHLADKGMQVLDQVRASAIDTWSTAVAKWDQSRAREVLHAAAVTFEVAARRSWARARACAEDPRACADAIATAAADRGRATWTAVRNAVGKGVPAAWARMRGYAQDAEEGEEEVKGVHADEKVELATSTEEEPAPAKTYVIDPRVQSILDMDRAMAASIEIELDAIRASMDARYAEQRARQEQSVAAKVERAWRYLVEWTSTAVLRRDLGAAEDDDERDEDVVLEGEDVLVTA
ncbi:hypothetical protein GGF31_001979 [Allomyces arbusculus]|nr:hypothetical protein GGF31_001979 [Allomyces arbusculus]